MRRWALLLAGLAVAGCAVRAPPMREAAPAYVVGDAYQSGGVWVYPRESFQLDATGLASILPDRPGLTANGERRDAGALAAAHPTLQLPAIVRVTNLETGLALLVRVNDRGPDGVHRVIGLTRHAGALLGIPPGGMAQVRIQVEDGPSQALRAQLQPPAAAMVATVRRDSVAAEPLAPPPGVRQSGRGRTAPAAAPAAEMPAMAAAEIVLPDRATAVPAAPGSLWIRAGSFSQAGFARQQQARLGGLRAEVARGGQGRNPTFAVRAGPYGSVADADKALDQAIQAGVTDARIVVE